MIFFPLYLLGKGLGFCLQGAGEAEDAQATHHALTRINGIVNRVQADVAVPARKLNLDDDEVMDVVQVLTDDLLSVAAVVAVQDQVAAGTHGDLVGNMPGKNKLPVIPLDLDLRSWLT